MFPIDDADYLRTNQYADSSNLNARIRLHQLFDTNPENLQRWTFDRMVEISPQSGCVLELGCGSGELWWRNKDRIPDDWTITLSDFSPGMLADATQRLGHMGLAFQVIDAQEIPYDDHTFGVVAAHFMLYHVPNRGRAIAEIRRVLKPSGVLFAITLGIQHMRELHEVVRAVGVEHASLIDPTSRPFSLENGARQLAEAFGKVTVLPFTCDLAVTETEPLIEYVRSMRTASSLITEDQTQQLRSQVQSIIDMNGSFHITKDTGLFVAQGYPGD